MAHSLATSAGLRPGSTDTLVPSLIFFVRAAANVSASTGSGAGPLMRSDSHSESKPLRLEPFGHRAERVAGQRPQVAEPVPDPDLHRADS